MEKQVRDQIYSHLKELNTKDAPNVSTAISTKEGYKEVEEKIIRLMATERMTISAAIGVLERSF